MFFLEREPMESQTTRTTELTRLALLTLASGRVEQCLQRDPVSPRCQLKIAAGLFQKKKHEPQAPETAGPCDGKVKHCIPLWSRRS